MLNLLREVSPRLHIVAFSAQKPEELPADLLNKAEVYYTDRVLPDPTLMPNLRWLQFHFSGIDYALDTPLVQKPDLMVTTISGAPVPQMSEYAVMMMLALGHKIPEIAANQAKAEWPNDRWERFSPVELHGSTVAIIGYGSIGREIARLLHPYQANVLAVKRDVMRPQDNGYTRPGLGDPNGDFFTRLYPLQALISVLKESDFVVVTLPLTPATRGLIGAAEIGAMKPGAYLVAIGRGGVIDQNVLLSALQERRLGGAALDVFTEEPLPASNPLWRLPSVIVTPHIAGISPHYKQRAVELFAENLRRYSAGEVLLNRFDTQRGY